MSSGTDPAAPASVVNSGVPALQASNLAKSFGAFRALKGVDLTINAGEVVALLGENGSGKSTLVKILSGYHEPEPGGELRMTDLAGSLYTTKSGLTYQITQLEKAGLVRRGAWRGDVRGVVAVLTDAGRQRLAQAAPGHVAAVRGLLIDVLTAEQVSAMADGLGEVARRLGDD